MTYRFAVLGHPVAHSLSPAIHGAFYARENVDAVYERADVSVADLPAFLERLAAEGTYHGLSVTFPHKEAMFRATRPHDAAAAACGAVNTLGRQAPGDAPPFSRRPGDVPYRGYNTDGEGFALFLERELATKVAQARVVMLGAGGSARSVLWALAGQAPASLTVVNRSAGRFAEPFFASLSARAPVELVAAAPDDERTRAALDAADVVIHATPVGLGGDPSAVVPWPVAHLTRPLIVDLNYRTSGPTPFLAQIPSSTRVHDGRGMLLYQAAVAFRVWFGRFPDTRGMLAWLCTKP